MERFEEWFAVRIKHRDDEFWPARLVYDPANGISLNTINFADPKLWYSNPTFSSETITGYIDYQRPATLLQPFIQSANPGTIGPDTPLCRARYRIVANGILSGIHMESLSERCFNGLRVELPAFHAWAAPQHARRDFTKTGEFRSVSVEIDEPLKREFHVSGGNRAEVLVYASVSQDAGNIPVTQHTLLSLHMPEATDYESIMQIAAALDILFAFLIGVRLESAVHYLSTTRTRRWNDADETIIAESWIVPAWKREKVAPYLNARMFTEDSTPVGIEYLLEVCLSGKNDLMYLMNVVLGAEMRDFRPEECFLELLGCLEDFDKTHFGSGANPEVRGAVKKLRRLVEQHGSEEDTVTYDRIRASFHDQFSLRQRLDRLIGMWASDGFRGRPEAARIVYLRNIKPHGRGRDLSSDMFREMTALLTFLCALARYHVLKVLGFDRNAIAAGFTRVPHVYGRFIPTELIPGKSNV